MRGSEFGDVFPGCPEWKVANLEEEEKNLRGREEQNCGAAWKNKEQDGSRSLCILRGKPLSDHGDCRGRSALRSIYRQNWEQKK